LGLTAQVRWLKGLHAKAFTFDADVAIVGSVNLSAASVDQQFQAVLETTDRGAIRDTQSWFDRLWLRAETLTPDTVKELHKLWPGKSREVGGSPRSKSRLPRWRSEPPVPAPMASEFSVGISRNRLQRLLREFRSNQCLYPDSEGLSCMDVALWIEDQHMRLGRELKRLMNRTNKWTKADLARVFDIAYTNGRAAKIKKPHFLRQRPSAVARTLSYLFNGRGDPYIRFEKILAPGGTYRLDGLGETGVAFLMHLWRPAEFAVINAPVDKGLKILQVTFGRRTSLRRAQGYKDRTAAIKHVASVTKLQNLARVDHFFDALGKGHIGRAQ
jgi:hypothetical protein